MSFQRNLGTLKKSSLSDLREWTVIPPGIEEQEGKTFRVLNWNILAPGNIDYGMYKEIPKRFLTWKHRRTEILNEIIKHEPDIISLQEVDKNGYHRYLHSVIH